MTLLLRADSSMYEASTTLTFGSFSKCKPSGLGTCMRASALALVSGSHYQACWTLIQMRVYAAWVRTICEAKDTGARRVHSCQQGCVHLVAEALHGH